MFEEVQTLLQQVPTLRGMAANIQPLLGGMTNRNYKIDVAGRAFVLRIFGPETELLGIDRAREVACAKAAASVGSGAEIVAFLPEQRALLSHFAPGQPLNLVDLAKPDVLPRIAATLRRCHAAPVDTNVGLFSVFDTVRNYLAQAQNWQVDLPATLGTALTLFERIENELAPREPPCLCHNDLLASNLIDDGTTIRLIDWEYAGRGNRFFDLGNLAVNLQMSHEQEISLLQNYFGAASPEHVRGLRLMRLASDLREASWGFLQQAIAKIEPPKVYGSFLNYGKKHLDRMLAGATAMNLK